MERFQAGKRTGRLVFWAGVLALVFVASWSAAATDQPALEEQPEAARLLAEAHRLAEAGDMDGAMRLIRQAEQLGAKNATSQQVAPERTKPRRSFVHSLLERLRHPFASFGKDEKKAVQEDNQAGLPGTKAASELDSSQSPPSQSINPFRPSRTQVSNAANGKSPAGGWPKRTLPAQTGRVQASSPQVRAFGSVHTQATSSESQLWNKVRTAMRGASEAEQRQMFEYLKTVDPAMVDPILKTWRMAWQMGQRKVVDYDEQQSSKTRTSQQDAQPILSAQSARPASTHGQLSPFDGAARSFHLEAPDPRRSRPGSQTALSPRPAATAQTWSEVGHFADPGGRAMPLGEGVNFALRGNAQSASQRRMAAAAAESSTAAANSLSGQPRGSATELTSARTWADQSYRESNPLQLGFDSSSPAQAGPASAISTGPQSQKSFAASSYGSSSVAAQPDLARMPRDVLQPPAGQRAGVPLAGGPSARSGAPLPQARSGGIGISRHAGPVSRTAGTGAASADNPAFGASARVQANEASVDLASASPVAGMSGQVAAGVSSGASASANHPTGSSAAGGSSGLSLRPLPDLRNLRTALQSAGQELQSTLTESPLGLVRRRSDQPPAAGNQSSASLTDEQLLQRLISAYELKVSQARPGASEDERLDFIRKHVQLRMLYFLAGQQERALEAIPYIKAADQEFWQQMFWAMANYFDREGIPDSSDRATQTIAQLKTAIQRLQQNARLQLRNVNFCHKIISYGNYERFDRDEFTPGQPVLLYAEVENFTSELTPEGQWRTVLKSTIEFYKAGRNGELVDRITFPPTEDLCRNHRRDYFQSYELTIPPKCSLGPHVLKLIVEDQLSQQVATYSVNFVVK